MHKTIKLNDISKETILDAAKKEDWLMIKDDDNPIAVVVNYKEFNNLHNEKEKVNKIDIERILDEYEQELEYRI